MPKKEGVKKQPTKKPIRLSRIFVFFCFALLLVVVFLTGISKIAKFRASTSDNSTGVQSAPAASSSGSAGSGIATDYALSGEKTSVSVLNATGPAIIKTGSAVITVTSTDTAVSALEALAKKEGGSVESSQVFHNTDACSSYPVYSTMMYTKEIQPVACSSYDAVVALRVPVAKLDETRDAIRRLDENRQLDSEQITASDVTDATEQLASQLKTARAEQSALQDLLAKAASVDDLLKIRTQLTNVQTQIQQLEQQQQSLTKDVVYARLTVSISEASSTQIATPSLGARFALAWKSLKENLAQVGTFGIYALVYAMVYVPVLLVVGGIVWLIVRKIRRSK